VGCQEGRRMFDNLKKSLCYTITSNIPELNPFLILIFIQIPVPLSSILMLVICVGTDMVPAISFSYEEGEVDIMTRRPRAKDAHLVTAKLMCFSYIQMGMIQTYSGLMGYVTVMWDFGFNVWELFATVQKFYYPHNPQDVYNPSLWNFGNTNIRINNKRIEILDTSGTQPFISNSDPAKGVQLDWLYGTHSSQDIRMGYLELTPDLKTVITSLTYSPCRVYQINPVILRPVCYSVEALKYAQTSYFVCTVLSQFFNSICCKTAKNSFLDIGLKNHVMIFGWCVEFMLCILFCYCLPLMTVFNTRDLILPHFMLPGVIPCLVVWFYDECRKYLVRNWPTDNIKYPNWFERNVMY